MNHRLNLCVANTCQLPLVRNMTDLVIKLSEFFDNSPKRQQHLISKIRVLMAAANHFVLVHVCRTRWIERIGMDQIEELLHPVVATLEDISMNRNSPRDGSNWNQNSRNDAQALINAITFSFIITIVIVRHILDLTRPLTVRLQKKAMDLLKAKEEIVLLKSALREMQTDLNTRHHALYEEAVTLARRVSVQPSMPRIVQRQVYRNNAPAPTPEDYYRSNLTTDFLNHALTQLDSRFEDDVFVCYKGFSVIPSILLAATDPICKDNFREFCDHYRQYIPNYVGLPAELLLWQRMWKEKKDRKEDIPDSIGATLEQIDKDAYVNIYTMLQMLITIPISSASCERSISTLRNLKTYLRNTMVQDRLNGLALMHAHREMELDLEKIVDLFATLHPRGMRMENILNE